MTVQPALPLGARGPAPAAGPAVESRLGLKLLALLGVGAATSVALGVYGGQHAPAHRTLLGMSVSDMLHLKAWLTTAVVALAVVQVVSALSIYGKLPSAAWVSQLHRWSGVVAFLVSLPVAFHCLWSLGFQTTDTRVLVHGLVGCLFYGAFAAKMLSLRIHKLPGWTLPLLGGAVFTAIVALWFTGSVWYFGHQGL